MKYILFDKEGLYWRFVYCTCDEETENLLENVAKSMFCGVDFKKFDSKENICINGRGIKNDEKIFSICDCGARYIWQLGSRVEDMAGFIVPHLYRVRKIGIMV